MPGGMQPVLPVRMGERVAAASKCRAERWSWGVLMGTHIYMQLGQVPGDGGQLLLGSGDGGAALRCAESPSWCCRQRAQDLGHGMAWDLVFQRFPSFSRFCGLSGEQRCPRGMLLGPVQYREHGGEILGCV